jgi:hypothetical protein
MSESTCKDRINQELKDRISDLKTLWNLYQEDSEKNDPDLGNFAEYGLCFDYVAPKTFKGQRKGYFRYQLSYGGPSDEFRFYTEQNFKHNPLSWGKSISFSVTKIEYVFLDWFDGASKKLTGKNFDLLSEIFQDFDDMGATESEYNKAMEN